MDLDFPASSGRGATRCLPRQGRMDSGRHLAIWTSLSSCAVIKVAGPSHPPQQHPSCLPPVKRNITDYFMSEFSCKLPRGHLGWCDSRGWRMGRGVAQTFDHSREWQPKASSGFPLRNSQRGVSTGLRSVCLWGCGSEERMSGWGLTWHFGRPAKATLTPTFHLPFLLEKSTTSQKRSSQHLSAAQEGQVSAVTRTSLRPGNRPGTVLSAPWSRLDGGPWEN